MPICLKNLPTGLHISDSSTFSGCMQLLTITADGLRLSTRWVQTEYQTGSDGVPDRRVVVLKVVASHYEVRVVSDLD